MDPNDFSTLPNLGNSLIHNFAPMPITISLYGIHVLLFSVFIIRCKSRPWKCVVAAVLGFLLATVNCAAGIVDLITLIRLHLIEYVEFPIDVQYALGVRRQFTSAILGQWTSDLMVWHNPFFDYLAMLASLSSTTMGNGFADYLLVVLCWWVIYIAHAESPKVFIYEMGPAVLLAFLVLISTPSGYASTFRPNNQNRQNIRLYNVGIILSLATNAVSTLLYGYKLWNYRKSVSTLQRRRSSIDKILFLLVESGVLYCCLQFVYVLLNTVPRIQVPAASLIASNLFFAAYVALSAVYPIVVLILADSKHSTTDAWEQNSGLSEIPQMDSQFRSTQMGQSSFALDFTQSAAAKSTEDDRQQKNMAKTIEGGDTV